jgi:ABC-type glycerol-3-phosphate transport system substrate-binding protein
MKQKLLFILFLGFISVFAVSGLSCRSTPAASKALNLWLVGYTADNFSNQLATFKAQNSATVNVTVETPAKLETDLLTAMAAHQGPDVVMVDNDFLQKHKDLFEACANSISGTTVTYCDPQIVKDQYAGIINNLVWDNKVYAYPYQVETPEVLYNVDMVSKAENTLKMYQVPYDWDNFVSLARALTQKDKAGNITVSGLAMGTANNVPASQDILYSLMLQNGTTISSSTSQALALFQAPLTGDTGAVVYPGTKALDFYTSFANPTSLNYSWNSSMPTAWQALAKGTAAMIIDYPSRLDDIRQLNPNIRVDGALFPQIADTTSPVVYGKVDSFGITTDTSNQVLAWNLARNLAQNFNTQYVKKSTSTTTWQQARGASFVWQTQVGFSQTVYKDSFPTEFDQAINSMINLVANKQATSQTAIDQTANQINQLSQSTNN